ncbi:hypothetical protein L596_000880 [Steinernema carpocapsae]|uniref:Uncharacterized protein n=1 Tax=Steinernema carpocapsae TaxID=34508 RepID=A0A4U8UJQ0_STECR|nr:hypothetical protein L596_000880 [Steinernema carpocapsae]
MVSLSHCSSTEGVSLNEVGSRFQVESVDHVHSIRAGLRQQVVVSLEGQIVISENICSKVVFLKMLTLDHCEDRLGESDSKDRFGRPLSCHCYSLVKLAYPFRCKKFDNCDL